jgi:hypothetical protein
MLQLKKVFLPIFLLTLLLGGQALAGPPMPPNPAPRWAPVPQAPGVEYAPNLAADLFRYSGQFFCYSQGLWQKGPTVNGPWTPVRRLPPRFYDIQAPYFKTPPGWAKGKKTGWRGAPLPPGQMKKYDQGGSLPPGQMKKLERGGSLPSGQMKKFE